LTQAFPLHWPEGWARTAHPKASRFDVSFVASRDGLLEQIRLLGARYPVISTNIELRRDGLPYANQPEPKDKGVAVYFEWKGTQRVFACDRWDKVKDNFRALEKTIEAMRGIERWGSSTMLERSFSAFVALPSNKDPHWSEVLGVSRSATPDEINTAYRRKAKDAHSDTGGSDAAMSRLNVARDAALKERGAS
jgi:hypothetical protein